VLIFFARQLKVGGMKQSRKMSLVEQITRTVVGQATGLAIQRLVFPWFGIHISIWENIGIGAIFTVAGMIEGYCLRRYFEYIRVNGKPAWIVACQSALSSRIP